MRPLLNMDTIQLEITNACPNRCGNCTRFVGHHPKPFFMDFEFFKKAVDSMVTYPKMTGIMGGEPLLHPDFEKKLPTPLVHSGQKLSLSQVA